MNTFFNLELLQNKGFSNAEFTVDKPRHRWYYYKEGFSPEFVEKVIEITGLPKNEIIIDPFNGSGTTTVTAALLGYTSIGIEVNPFTSFLASTKLKNADIKLLESSTEQMIAYCSKGASSNLIGYSTFTYKKDFQKWLFNRNVLRSFEGGWKFTDRHSNRDIQKLLKLALIISAMDNCNAVKDGKCLRYRQTWRNYGYNSDSFIETVKNRISIIKEDILTNAISAKSRIVNGDVRKILNHRELPQFKLCITSPPYLNTFDYTDIYRPELFLGKFVCDNDQLYKLRLKTVRSHVQAKWDLPKRSDFGPMYDEAIRHMNNNPTLLMDRNIPVMIQAYFEDMRKVLKQLKVKAKDKAQLWLVVSNSAYAGYEVPVDLIIGDLGSRVGWNLKEIAVMRQVQKRKTKYSPNILELRESIVIFENLKT